MTYISMNSIRNMTIYLKQFSFFKKNPVYSLKTINVHHIPDTEDIIFHIIFHVCDHNYMNVFCSVFLMYM